MIYLYQSNNLPLYIIFCSRPLMQHHIGYIKHKTIPPTITATKPQNGFSVVASFQGTLQFIPHCEAIKLSGSTTITKYCKIIMQTSALELNRELREVTAEVQTSVMLPIIARAVSIFRTSCLSVSQVVCANRVLFTALPSAVFVEVGIIDVA